MSQQQFQEDRQKFREEAIPFITFSQDNSTYHVNEEAEQFIKNIPQPLGVIAVAGLYRTGKSYLLNRMLLNRSNGFGVGPTVNPCTKGLWVWGSPIKGFQQDGSPINIIIIDSEGIGALDEDQTHDSKVFSLAILLSSQFIYNSVGSIDENAIQNLSLVVNLTKHIQIKSNNNDDCDSDEYSQHFPQFFWVIRDFSLQLVDQEGEQITSKDYLENSLKEQKGISDEIESKNRIRRLLTSFFKERECITLVRPLVNEDNLQKLDQMELDELRPEFFEQVMVFRKKILSHCKPKTMNGKTLNGDMYMSLVRNFIASINDGAVPNIENAWNYVCKDECYKASNNAMDTCNRFVKESILPKLPVTSEELKLMQKQAKEYSLEVFKNVAVGEIADEYKRKVVEKIKDYFMQINQENERLSVETARGFIEREFSSIDKKLKMLEYKSYPDFSNDVQLFYKFLLEHGPKVQNKNLIYLDFYQKKLHEGASLFLKNLQNDLQIQKECSKEMMEKNQADIKQLKEQFQEQNYKLEQQIQNLEKQKIEYQANEKRNEETIKEQEEQILKIENELKQDLLQEKSTYQSQIEKLQSQLQTNEESLQTVQRELLIKESDFTKEKALLEHKAQHFEQQLNEHLEKEKQFDTSMIDAKSQLNTQMKQLQEQYDSDLQNEKSLTKQLQEQLQDAIYNKECLEKQLEAQIESLNEKNTDLSENNTNLQQKIQKQTEELEKLLGDNMKQSENIDNIVSQQLENLKQENSEMSEKIKNLTESLKNSEQTAKKEKALLEQKTEFLTAELEDTKEKLEDQRQAHQQTLNTLELNHLEKQNELANMNESKKLLEMKEQHLKDLQQQEQQFQNKMKNLQESLENIQKENSENELKFKVSENDYQDQIKTLTENVALIESQKQEIQLRLNKFEETYNLNSMQSESMQQQQIRELENTIEQLREKMQNENNEQQEKQEQILAEIKLIHENEKERLENRLNEEKSKREKTIEAMQEEFDDKVREQAEQYEEEIETLKDELMQLENNLSTITSQYEHELDLKIKSIENMEAVISETKEQLQNQQKQFTTQLEQQQTKFQQEKQSITAKLETLITESQQKDKDLMKLQQKKESIENTLARKEELWENTKKDLINDKNTFQTKLEETRKNYQKLQDEFLQHKINYEKSIALSTQQNEFFEKKVEELQKQLEQSSSRYEERIKAQKAEWQTELNDKLGKLQSEKDLIETRYEELKKSVKEGDLSQSKRISALEKEKAIIQEKLINYTNKYNELEEKSKSQIISLEEQLSQYKNQFSTDRKSLDEKLESFKKQIQTLEQEKHDLQSTLDKDQVLWEGKFNFLSQQKEQAKSDLQEARKNFELTLQKLKDTRNNDQHDNKVQEQLESIDKKYQQQIQDLNDGHENEVNQLNQKIKKMEKEIQAYNDKQIIDQHSKNSNQIYTEKKMNELFETNKKLQEQLEVSKEEKEKLQQLLQQKSDKEKESYKVKINELEEKFREGERKRNNLMFEFEKERARWNLEKDHLHSQRADLQDSINRLEKKKESLLRENERLKNDNRQSRRQQIAQGTSFNLNMSRNQSTDRKSPMNNRTVLGYGGTRFSNANDHSYLGGMNNNSFQNEEHDKENTGNILGQLDSAREQQPQFMAQQQQQQKDSGIKQQGFQTFMMKNSSNLQQQSQQSQNTEESQSPALQEKDLN